ncbi:hypothetical protein [Lichenicoccus sp.]|uniref:hypothetical protein n=1 Tax=Lichenicoccus sp. TaxID=2781899 RepID=UPI003D0B9F05
MIAKVGPTRRLGRRATVPGISALALIEMIGIAASLVCGSTLISRTIGGPSLLVAGLHEPAPDTQTNRAPASVR